MTEIPLGVFAVLVCFSVALACFIYCFFSERIERKRAMGLTADYWKALADLNLAAQFDAEGRSYVDLDDDGNVVYHEGKVRSVDDSELCERLLSVPYQVYASFEPMSDNAQAVIREIRRRMDVEMKNDSEAANRRFVSSRYWHP